MNDEKRGKFLKQLRIEKNLTQKQASEKLHYSDNALSNWEKGKTLPNNPETLVKLSELYDVSIEELLYGERKNNKNSKEISNNMENIYKKNYKNFKTALNLSIILLLVIVVISLILTYFIFIKGKILSYTIQGASEHFILDKSSILFTEKIDILNFNKIESLNDEKINYIKVYYKIEDNEYLIFKGPNDNYYIEEPPSSKEYNLKMFLSRKIYVEVNYNDNSIETIELNISQRFINDNIVISKSEKTVEPNIQHNDKGVKTFLLKEGFQEIDDCYEKSEKKVRIVYNKEMKKIYLYNQSKNIHEQIQLDLEKNNIFYEYFDENQNDYITETYSLSDNGSFNTTIKFIDDNIEYLIYLKSNL